MDVQHGGCSAQADRPVLSTKIELVDAPAMIVKGVLPPVESSIENLLAPPDALSFAMMRQSFFGNPVAVLVSSKSILRLFSFSLSVSKSNTLVVHAVETDAGAPLHDEVVRDDLIRDRLAAGEKRCTEDEGDDACAHDVMRDHGMSP